MISDYAANKLLDQVLRAQAALSATPHLALFTTGPIFRQDDIGSFFSAVEVGAGLGYARKPITFGAAAAGGIIWSTAAVTFDPVTSSWGTIMAVAIVDASTAGHILFFKNICPQVVSSGDSPPSFPIKAIKAMMGYPEQ